MNKAAKIVQESKPKFQAAIMVAFNNCPVRTKAFIAELRILGIDMSDDIVLYNMMLNNVATTQLIELSRVRMLHEISQSLMRIIECQETGDINKMKDRVMASVNFNKEFANDFITELKDLECPIQDATNIGGLISRPVEFALLINYSVLGILRKVIRLRKSLLITTK